MQQYSNSHWIFKFKFLISYEYSYTCTFIIFISAWCLWRVTYVKMISYGKMAEYCLEGFDLVEQEKDGKKIENAAYKICADTALTYVGGTSNLMHHLEAK